MEFFMPYANGHQWCRYGYVPGVTEYATGTEKMKEIFLEFLKGAESASTFSKKIGKFEIGDA